MSVLPYLENTGLEGRKVSVLPYLENPGKGKEEGR